MMELLAPAGERAALEAALQAGADAVYLGLHSLNARRGAGNFSDEELADATAFCHARGAKVYVTVNTLVKDAEMPALRRVASALAAAGADAAIVQDLGVIDALSRMLPDLPLHASTQMALHNLQGVRAAKALGLKRVVLARELSLSEIQAVSGEGVELEVFAHGALCVSCSGQCLMSSLIGGRSGNRGLCAQPCRLPYRLDGAGLDASGALLSPKDLMTLPMLARLAEAGAHSLKLEGRLKGPDYVYAVTRAYRAALDGDSVEPRRLRQVFNRGYTASYLTGLVDADLIADERETHVEPAKGDALPPCPRLVPVSGRVRLTPGDAAELSVTDGTDAVRAAGALVERSQKPPVDAERYLAQLQKTGDTPYRFTALEADISPDAFVRVSALNALRRDALASLDQKRVERFRGCARTLRDLPDARPTETVAAKPRLSVQAQDAERLLRARALGADELIYEITDTTSIEPPDAPYTLLLPPTLATADLGAVHDAALRLRPACVLLSNLAHLALRWPCPVRLDYPMNLFNARAVERLGLPYAPSVELTAAEIRALPGERELIVYGRLPLMTLRHCPLNARRSALPHAQCHACDAPRGPRLNDAALVDRTGAAFPLERLKTGSGCIVRLRNSVPLMLLRRWEKLPPAARVRVILTREDARLSDAVVALHRAALDGEPLKEQNGWALLEALPSTTGHFFRGVE